MLHLSATTNVICSLRAGKEEKKMERDRKNEIKIFFELPLILIVLLAVALLYNYKPAFSKEINKTEEGWVFECFTITNEDILRFRRAKPLKGERTNLTVIEKIREEEPTSDRDYVKVKGELHMAIVEGKLHTFSHQNSTWHWNNDLKSKNHNEISKLDEKFLLNNSLKLYQETKKSSIYWLGGIIYFDYNGNYLNKMNSEKGTRFLRISDKGDKKEIHLLKISLSEGKYVLTIIKKWTQ